MDDILSLLQDFDVANFLPEPDKYLNSLEGWIRLIVLAGPLVLLGLGLWYYFAPPKEANHSAGFRNYWGMGSVEAWRFAQKLAGMGYTVLGGALTVIMLVTFAFWVNFRHDKKQRYHTSIQCPQKPQCALTAVVNIAVKAPVCNNLGRQRRINNYKVYKAGQNHQNRNNICNFKFHLSFPPLNL